MKCRKCNNELTRKHHEGGHVLLCGDSTDKAAVDLLMAGEKADMVFTSPPYSDLRNYRGELDLTPVKLAQGIFLFDAGFYCINLGLIIREREIQTYWNDYLTAAKNSGHKLLSWNVWDKGNASAPAHQQAMFGLSHEWVFVFGEYTELNLTNPNKGEEVWGQASVREKDGSLAIKTNPNKTRTHRQLDSVLRLDAQKNFDKENYTDHPAQFPVTLPTEYILAGTNSGGLVSDPFLGSGSTLIACEKTKRNCYGMEIDPHYCSVIIKRWQEFTGKTAVKA